MPHQDKLYRFIFDDLDIRGELVYLDESWRRVCGRGDYPSSVRRQLGEALAAVAILSATIKYEGSLILQIQGAGPLSTLVVQSTPAGRLRGLARWSGQVPEYAELSEIYGQGQMAITVDNRGGERYQSIVALEGDSLAEALEHYFAGSEQLGSRFWLFVGERQVAGLFLQQLPDRSTGHQDWERVTLLAGTTSREEIFSLPPEILLQRLFHEEKVRLFEPRALSFACSCSREKIESTLYSMGRQSVQDIIDQEGSVEVDCEFCNQHYSFGQQEVDRLFTWRDPSDESNIIH